MYEDLSINSARKGLGWEPEQKRQTVTMWCWELNTDDSDARTCPQNGSELHPSGSFEMDHTWKEDTREAKNNLAKNCHLRTEDGKPKG